MLWYDKIIINLWIAKYIWRGDGQHEKEENRTTKSLEFQPIGRQMIDTLRVVDKVGVGEGNLPR